jgi:MOSC domain-containing protein YiiM
MIERFLSSRRCGYYFSVVEKGEVGAGDEFQALGGEAPTISILETFQAYTSLNLELLQRAARVKTLPESWQEHFQTRIDAIERAARFERNSQVR